MWKEYTIEFINQGISAESMEAIKKRFDIHSNFGGLTNSDLGKILDRVVRDLEGDIMFEEENDLRSFESERHYVVYDPPGAIFFDGWVSVAAFYGRDHNAIDEVRSMLEEKSQILKFKEIKHG